MSKDDNGDGTHVPLNEFTAENQVLVSVSPGEVEAVDAETFVTTFGGGGGSAQGLGEIASVSYLPLTSSIAGGALTVDTVSVDPNAVNASVPSWISAVPGMPTLCKLDPGSYLAVITSSFSGDLGTETGQLLGVFNRSGNTTTGFFNSLAAGVDFTTGSQAAATLVSGTAGVGYAYLVSIPNVPARQNFKLSALANGDPMSGTGTFNGHVTLTRLG